VKPSVGELDWVGLGIISDWRFAPDSRSVLTSDLAGKVTRWSGVDFQEPEPLLTITNYTKNGFFSDAIFSADGRFLAVGSTNGIISVWDLLRRILRLEFKPGDGHVTPLSFLARGNRLACWAGAGNRFAEWDLEANREIQT
jgi:WD40 repeat protein